MITRPSQTPGLQPNRPSGNFDPPMTDDSETIATRVTVIAGDRLADDYQVTCRAHLYLICNSFFVSQVEQAF
jgi:hypothetical protein